MDYHFSASFPPLVPYCDARFRIEEMALTFNAIDLEAVLSSRESLRVWSESSWPEDDFSLEQNSEDLQGHIADHKAGTIYAYSILSPDGKVCLGSIYIRPIAAVQALWTPDPLLQKSLALYGARVDYWLRDSEGARGGDLALLKSFQAWTPKQWTGKLAFASRPAMTERRRAYELADLQPLGLATSKSTSQVLHLHG